MNVLQSIKPMIQPTSANGVEAKSWKILSVLSLVYW